MKKRVLFIHGWAGAPDEGWRPWLKEELENRGFEVVNPAMPNSRYPVMSEWVDYLRELIGKPDEDCYLVGHSLGAITILRYLESLQPGEKIGGAVFVAGFTGDINIAELADFVNTPVNFEKAKKHCKKFVAIHSDNDYYVPLWYGDLFQEELDAELVVLHNMHHMSGDDGIIEVPAILESLLRLTRSNSQGAATISP